MEKLIWIIGSDRAEMLDAQKRINSTGSMRAFCMLTFEAVKKAAQAQERGERSRISTPSLIILDYETERKEDFAALLLLKEQQALAGVPLFFMVDRKSEELDEECYARGATVVLQKPFSDAGILRLERTAWQYEVAKNYEKMLQKQAGDLLAAKEILRLNQQLESRNRLLHQIFGRYFSDKVVDHILEHPEGAVVGGEKRELTAMMADLRGFTSLSESMEPEVVTDLLNCFFGKMLDVITQYNGIVIEFLGDAILAVFGATHSASQTADAVAAAIVMQNRMEEVNQYCRKRGCPLLEMGIGIHRGEMFIGNVGSEKMMRYNIIGQAVNQCSRIEGFSVGGQVLVSRETVAKLDIPIRIRSSLEIVVKGIKRPLEVCEVSGILGSYQCILEDTGQELPVPAACEVLFHLKLIEGKVILEKSFTVWLDSISRKRAKVRWNTDETEGPDLFSDVEVTASDAEGAVLFRDVYAKIVSKTDKEAILHFTHINRDFQEFADSILSAENAV